MIVQLLDVLLSVDNFRDHAEFIKDVLNTPELRARAKVNLKILLEVLE